MMYLPEVIDELLAHKAYESKSSRVHLIELELGIEMSNSQWVESILCHRLTQEILVLIVGMEFEDEASQYMRV
jgi:hypothetical protein